MKTSKNYKPTAVDFFAGAGGLSEGLKKAGFDVVAAVEIEEKLTPTYRANHKKTTLIEEDIRKVSGKEILKKAGVKKIDLIAGCPPCQGFSQLTEKHKRNDPRNNLVLEMARLVEELEPTAVMMENVPGLAGKGKKILDKFIKRIEKKGYKVNYDVLQLADYGIPQSRRRFVLLAGKGFEISLPVRTHCEKGDLKNGLKPWLTLKDTIVNIEKPITLSEAMEKGGPEKFRWNVVRDLQKQTIRRLEALEAGDNRRKLPKKLRPDCHKKSNKGFQNVYGRLSWNQVPPTITSGCTTLSMGRFGHPEELRTISVREAAMIQTFSVNYKFKTEYMDWACRMVGNALPPKFAKIAGKTCLDAIFNNRDNNN